MGGMQTPDQHPLPSEYKYNILIHKLPTKLLIPSLGLNLIFGTGDLNAEYLNIWHAET